MGILLEQRRTAHHHAWRAEAALHGIVFHERGLQGMRFAVRRYSFNRRHLVSDRIHRQGHAAVHRHLVEPDRTSGAGSAIANDFGPCHSEMNAQGISQGGAGLDLQALLFAVDFEVNGNWTGTLVPVTPGLVVARILNG